MFSRYLVHTISYYFTYLNGTYFFAYLPLRKQSHLVPDEQASQISTRRVPHTRMMLPFPLDLNFLSHMSEACRQVFTSKFPTKLSKVLYLNPDLDPVRVHGILSRKILVYAE